MTKFVVSKIFSNAKDHIGYGVYSQSKTGGMRQHATCLGTDKLDGSNSALEKMQAEAARLQEEADANRARSSK